MDMNDHDPTLTEQDLADLAALADGSLDASRVAGVEERIAASPAMGAEFARQRRAIDRVVAAQRQVGAPAKLRAKVTAERARRAPVVRLPRFGLAAGGAALVAVALVVVFFVLPGGVNGERLIAAAAATHGNIPERPAPQEASPTLLDFEKSGVAFPAYRTKFGWDAVGERDDRVEGRDVATVIYRKGDRAVGYSVVAGGTVSPPKSARTVVQEGNTVRVFNDGPRTIAVVERQGHTCVLSGVDVPDRTIVELAGWTGKGTVPFD